MAYQRGRYEEDEGPAYGASASYGAVPDIVQSFVIYLYRHIREKNVYEIHQMYEGSFNKITERMFKQSPWPVVDAIAPFVENDHVFCLLYKELYFRHVFARLTPTLEQRMESWDNYCTLFQIILHGNVNMQLPNQWLWDMVDEFIYQFQSFCQYRAKMKARSEEELKQLRQYDQVWNVYGVLNYLQALIDKSQIYALLDNETARAAFTSADGYDYQGGSNVLKVLGYFSIVGLLRVHILLGDYHGGLKVLEPLDISRPGVFTKVSGCHITTMYYAGFAYLMIRRYVDAIKVFNAVLVYIARTQTYLAQSPQYDQITKKNEQLYALLATALALSPQNKLVEETVSSQLREKHGDKLQRLQGIGYEVDAIYDELFSFACPKFITPSTPNWDEPPVNFNQDAYRLQLKIFLTDVRQQQRGQQIRSYLKLYTTISVAKLASFVGSDEATVRSHLLTYKHKTHIVDSVDGSIYRTSDIDFSIEGDMIHVAETKTNRRFGDFFVRNIVKFDDVVRDLEGVDIKEVLLYKKEAA